MGELINKLSNESKKLIEFYIDNYSDDDNEDYPCGNRAPLDVILNPWEKNKKELFDLFGGQFILSRDYEYHCSKDDMLTKIRYSSEYNKFRQEIENKLWRNDKIIPLRPLFGHDARFWSDRLRTIGKPGYEKTYAEENFYMGIDELVDNRCARHYSFLVNGEKVLDFPENSKYMKMLGKICHYINLDNEYEEFRLWHSLTLNNKTLKGHLCISIHPLDFMTMSDNASGWDSCMSWQNHGCYRMGTVEMMNSPCVIVAYLTSEEDMKIGQYTWNNKKWRELFVIDQDVITEVKPYPYRNDELADAILVWLNELTGKQYSDEVFEFGEGENRYSNMYRINAQCNKMYNDFSSCRHRAIIKLPIPSKIEGKVRSWHFNYSGPTECMWCGTTLGDFSADSLYCDDCSSYDRCYCGICGRRINEEDSYYDEDRGEYICDSCLDEYYVRDQVNDEWIEDDRAIEVYLASNRNNPDEYYDRSITVHRAWYEDTIYRKRNGYSGDRKNTTPVHCTEDCVYYVNLDECGTNWLWAFFRSNKQIYGWINSYDKEHSYKDKTFLSLDTPFWEPVKELKCYITDITDLDIDVV